MATKRIAPRNLKQSLLNVKPTSHVNHGSGAIDPNRTIPQMGFARSEIRLVRARHVRLLSRVPIAVFGALVFGPVQGTVSTSSIRHGRGPRRGEDVLILNGEFKLQVLAGSVRGRHPGCVVMLLCVPFE